MRKKVYNYFKEQVVKLRHDKVLDIGSFDVNGSLKPLFEKNYLGLDMRAGKNVDIVANSHLIPFPDNSFDMVVSAETLEHDDLPFETMKEIRRVLKYDGWCVISVPGIGYPVHSYPDDYWRFTESAVKVLLKNFKDVETTKDGDAIFGKGRK